MKAIIVFAKFPEPHKVKTRLGARIGYEHAADLYRLFIEQTLLQAVKAAADQIFVAHEPIKRGSEFQEILPAGISLFPQNGIDLGERMLNAFQWAFSRGESRVVIIGSDSPTLPPQFLNSAFDHLLQHDIVIGPAEDGGYYLIGSSAAHPRLFENIEWSAPTVLQKTLERANAMKLTTALLPEWYDVDEVESLQRAAADDASGAIKNFLHEHSIQLAKK